MRHVAWRTLISKPALDSIFRRPWEALIPQVLLAEYGQSLLTEQSSRVRLVLVCDGSVNALMVKKTNGGLAPGK